MVRRALAIAFVLAALAGGSAHAGGEPGKPAPALTTAALVKTEADARAKAADELARLAKYCALTNAFDDARRDYARALAFVPASAPIAAELAKIKGRTAKPSKQVQEGIVGRRTAALAKCYEFLAPAARAWAKAERCDELGAFLVLMRSQGLSVDALFKELEIVRYEPYLDWRTKSAVEKLDAGWEYVDGEWLDPEKVAALDAAHSTWGRHWVFSDEVHEVRTTMSRRTAKQVLAHVGAYRRFFLDYFTGEWDLVQPKVKLPVIVTATRKEMEARSAEFGLPYTNPKAAAWYLHSGGPGGPCFVSFEASMGEGVTSKLDFTGVRRMFEHELGHQIAFEYSKHAEGRGNSEAFKWVVEGVADFLPNYDLVDGKWTLMHPRYIGAEDADPYESPDMISAFRHCKENAANLPTLSIFFELPPAQFDATSYMISSVLVCYLLEGKDREYRPKFIDLVEAVHRERATKKSFEACFEGIDLDTLGAEWRDFAAAVELDE